MKRKGVTKITALALTAAMSMGLLAGCGGEESGASDSGQDSQQQSEQQSQQGSQSQGESNSTNTPSVDKFDESATAASNGINLPALDTLSITVNMPSFNLASEGTQFQQLWQEKMEAYLGCKLDITWVTKPWADYRETEKTLLQTGDIKDVTTSSIGAAINEYGEDGSVLNLADYMDYMVYYPEYMADTNGGENFARNEDGSMFYFMDGFYNPNNVQGAQSMTAFAYRFDILQANDWKPATTLDEFTQLCADIHAKKDELGLDYVIANNSMDFFRGFAGIFHTWECAYYNGSEWVFGPIEDNFRDMLRYLNGLYEAGYIDVEYNTAGGDSNNEKATNGKVAIVPTLWSGMAATWNKAMNDVDSNNTKEWGLAYLPDGPDGTAWKWGSRQDGKSLNQGMGIFINAETEHPEHIVAMIDYQYSDQMVNWLNWGIEGETYTVNADGSKTYVDEIMNDESPATKSAEYGLMASSVCRTGIPFVPLDNDAMTLLSSQPEPWWSADKGYYEGKYWIETSVNGGPDSVSPYDRPPVMYLSPEQQALRAQLNWGGVCTKQVLTYVDKFIQGELDIDDDSVWEEYVESVKSQTDEDFDSIIDMLNEKTVK